MILLDGFVWYNIDPGINQKVHEFWGFRPTPFPKMLVIASAHHYTEHESLIANYSVRK